MCRTGIALKAAAAGRLGRIDRLEHHPFNIDVYRARRHAASAEFRGAVNEFERGESARPAPHGIRPTGLSTRPLGLQGVRPERFSR